MPSKWKPSSAVKRVWVANPKKPALLGGRTYGKVFVGRMEFLDGSKHRVAIKRFDSKISDETAKKYQQAINDLRNAGVRLPKMAMVKMGNEWVQVSQLFGSTKKGSKLSKKEFKIDKSLPARFPFAAKKDFITQMTKIGNAGDMTYFDTILAFNKMEKGAIPLDLDLLVHNNRPNLIALQIHSYLEKIGSNLQEKQALRELALKTANPALKKRILEEPFT